jgi:hypothetical protein
MLTEPKALLAADDAARINGNNRVLDFEFIAEHTSGFDDFAAAVRGYDWDELERRGDAIGSVSICARLA